MTVLTVNIGSSSVKLRWLEDECVVATVDITAGPAVADGDLVYGVESAVSSRPPPQAVVHRIVHGGNQFRDAVLIDDAVMRTLRDLTDLAPDHQRRALVVIDALGASLPDFPHVAVFDTAFHSTLPPAATTLAIPVEWREAWGVRRFGFHGLSHAYSSRRALELLGRRHGRVVVAHLGSGCFLATTVDGQSVETTMGFTPLDGLVMGTRSGSVDPGLIPWLEAHHAVSSARALEALEHESGLRALAGTADMREVVSRSLHGPERDQAQLALDVFVHRLVLGIGSMAAAAGGMDALVFTGGIGENSPHIRGAAAVRLRHLGVQVDEERNAQVDTSDRDISKASAPCRVHVVRAREEVQMVRAAAGVLERTSARLRGCERHGPLMEQPTPDVPVSAANALAQPAPPEPRTPEVAPTRPTLLRREGEAALAVALAVSLLAFGLPRVAGVSWRQIGDVLSTVTPLGTALLTAVRLAGLWLHTIALSAALPGLNHRRAFFLNITGSAVSNVLPLGGAAGSAINLLSARRWDFSTADFLRWALVTNIWDVLSRLVVPGIALTWLALDGSPSRAMRDAGLGASGLLVGLMVFTIAALRTESWARRAGELADRVVRRVDRRRPRGSPMPPWR